MVVSIAGIPVCPGARPPPPQRRRDILISGLIGHLSRQPAPDDRARQRLLDLAEDGESSAQTGQLGLGQPALELPVDGVAALEARLIGRVAPLGGSTRRHL